MFHNNAQSTPVCKFFQRGMCTKGSRCAFKHTYSISEKDQVLCSHNIQGACRYGKYCQLIHGNICTHCNKPCLHPFNQEQAEGHTKRCAQRAALVASLPEDMLELTNKADCGVCLDNVMSKGMRFGLMTECDHAFCLPCIRAWRRKAKDVNNPSSMVKSCPTCRKESLFILPSTVFCVGEFKQSMINQYKINLKKKRCKHYDRTKTCPFGADCFFAHLNPDGSAVDSSTMKNIVTNKAVHNPLAFGSDIIDLLSHVTNLHPSYVMDLLMDLLVDDEWNDGPTFFP